MLKTLRRSVVAQVAVLAVFGACQCPVSGKVNNPSTTGGTGSGTGESSTGKSSTTATIGGATNGGTATAGATNGGGTTSGTLCLSNSDCPGDGGQVCLGSYCQTNPCKPSSCDAGTCMATDEALAQAAGRMVSPRQQKMAKGVSSMIE